jgi:hypothetical protein
VDEYNGTYSLFEDAILYDTSDVLDYLKHAVEPEELVIAQESAHVRGVIMGRFVVLDLLERAEESEVE